MASRDDGQAAVLHRRIVERDPDGEEVGRLGVLQQDRDVLVPGHTRDRAIPLLLRDPRQRSWWQLRPKMLERMRVDLWTDDVLDEVEHARMAQRIEDRRPEVD